MNPSSLRIYAVGAVVLITIAAMIIVPFLAREGGSIDVQTMGVIFAFAAPTIAALLTLAKADAAHKTAVDNNEKLQSAVEGIRDVQDQTDGKLRETVELAVREAVRKELKGM